MTLGDMIKRLEEYAEEAVSTFGDLSAMKFNWKPNPESWSVGQCFEHLVVANKKYVSLTESAAEGRYNESIWERMPGLPKLTGKLVIKTIHPDNVKKSKAPKLFQPSRSEIPTGMLNDYVDTSKQLREQINKFSDADIKDKVITSPIAKIATYSLYDAFTIVVLHDRRHINQAVRVTETAGFPK